MSKSPLIASNANTWVNCTGQVQLSLQYPAIESGDGVSEARLEGRAFHEVSQNILESFKKPSGKLVNRFETVGTLSKDGIVITDEIYDGALEYSTDVFKVCNSTGMLRYIQIEEHVDLSGVFPSMYGYVDCWLYDEQNHKLYVWDAKFGHRSVDAFENWQLITYVVGILESLGIDDDNLTISLRVAQPRSYKNTGCIDEWLCTLSELRVYIETVKSAAIEAYSDSATCKTGKQCLTCSARYACGELQQVSYTSMDYLQNVEGVSLTGHHLALELRLLKRAQDAIKSRLSGLEEQALSELASGGTLPGFATRQGFGRRRWRKDTPVEEVIMMGDLMNVNVRKPDNLDTPAQVLKKGIDESVIDMYSETPMTGLKLVEDDGSKARNVFRKQHS